MLLANYKALVIGCGKIGSEFSETSTRPGPHSHAEAYAKHPRTTLAAVCDLDSSRAESAATFWSVPAYTDPLSACTELQPDLISICTPDSTHAPLTKEILQRCSPKLIFVEKPLALHSSEARPLVQLAENKAIGLAVNYSRRYLPLVRKIKSELAAGTHGAPLLMRALYGKGLFHNGTHALDLARFWLGEPTKIERLGSPAWGPANDPTLEALLTYSSGARFQLQAFDERVATIFELDLFTEKSRWSFRLGGSQWEYFAVKDSPLHPGYKNYLSVQPLSPTHAEQALTHALDNLVAYLDTGEALLCSGGDALRTLEIAEKIRSA